MLSACQKADSNCCLGQQRSACSGIHATGDHSVRSVLQNTERTMYSWPFRMKGMECWHSVYAPPWQRASACSCLHLSTTGAFQPGAVWSSSLQCWSHSEWLTTCLPAWRSGWDHSTSTRMRSWWNVSKHGWAHRQQTSLTQAYKNLFPNTTGASILAMTTLRSSLSMYVFLCV
jgi:hypothetical protein